MSITLSPETTERLHTVARLRGMDPEELLLSLLDSEEDTLRDREWWDALSEEERAAERAIIARSIAEADAGKVRPAEEVYARIRAKYAARKGGIS